MNRNILLTSTLKMFVNSNGLKYSVDRRPNALPHAPLILYAFISCVTLSALQIFIMMHAFLGLLVVFLN